MADTNPNEEGTTQRIMEGDKEYLLNYNSRIMYPYTLLECIIGDASTSGIDAINKAITVHTVEDGAALTGRPMCYDHTTGNLMCSNEEFKAIGTLESTDHTVVEGYPQYLGQDGKFHNAYDSSVMVKLTHANILRSISTSLDTGSAPLFEPQAAGEGFITLQLKLSSDYFKKAIHTSAGVLEVKDAESFKIARDSLTTAPVVPQNVPIAYTVDSSNVVRFVKATKWDTNIEKVGNNDASVNLLCYAGSGDLKSIAPITDASNYVLVSTNNHVEWKYVNNIVPPVTINNPDSNTTYYLCGCVDGQTSDIYRAKYDSQSASVYFKGGTLYNASDENLKTFTSYLDVDLDMLAEIKKGLFYWKGDPDMKQNLGVTAQSVEALFPQIVDEVNGVKHVAYQKLGVIALAAIDKLHQENKNLREEIEKLKEMIYSKN